jgi:hypothetical protein
MSNSLAAIVPLGTAYNLPFIVRNSSGVPVNADALPTYRTYDSDVANYAMSGGGGTAAFRHTFTVTGAANNGSGLIRITTSAAHNLATGQVVTISGVGGVSNANGTFVVTVITGTTFDLQGSSMSGTYTSGGTGNVTGLYYAQVAVTSGNGFGREKCFPVVVTYAISGANQSQVLYLQVV